MLKKRRQRMSAGESVIARSSEPGLLRSSALVGSVTMMSRVLGPGQRLDPGAEDVAVGVVMVGSSGTPISDGDSGLGHKVLCVESSNW